MQPICIKLTSLCLVAFYAFSTLAGHALHDHCHHHAQEHQAGQHQSSQLQGEPTLLTCSCHHACCQSNSNNSSPEPCDSETVAQKENGRQHNSRQHSRASSTHDDHDCLACALMSQLSMGYSPYAQQVICLPMTVQCAFNAYQSPCFSVVKSATSQRGPPAGFFIA